MSQAHVKQFRTCMLTATNRETCGIRLLALVVTALVVLLPMAALADGHEVRESVIAAIRKAKSYDAVVKAIAEIPGITEQQKVESYALYTVLSADPEPFLAYREKLPKEWKTEEALYLKSRRQIEAVVYYAEAIRAKAVDDMPKFESSIKQAVWLDPEMTHYVSAIKKYQEEQEWVNKSLPMDVKVRTSDGNETTLGELAKDCKGIYVQIWASWCGPCIAQFPELEAWGKQLPPQGVAVAALNSEGQEAGPGGNRSRAQNMRSKHNMTVPWLIEPDNETYSKQLGLESWPFAVLLTPQGKVLFRGHPADDGLLVAIRKLKVTVERLEEQP